MRPGFSIESQQQETRILVAFNSGQGMTPIEHARKQILFIWANMLPPPYDPYENPVVLFVSAADFFSESLFGET